MTNRERIKLAARCIAGAPQDCKECVYEANDDGCYKSLVKDMINLVENLEAQLEEARKATTEPPKDNVNHPGHYETGKFECIDVMEETQGLEATMNFCVCNAFKCIYRHNRKNGIEDIEKAKWYLAKYLELSERSEAGDDKR